MEIFTPDMPAAKLSIKKLSELNYEILLPGHGSPVTETASEKANKFAKTYCK